MIFDSHDGITVELDISLLHQWAKDIVRESAKTTGFAAARRETQRSKIFFLEVGILTAYQSFMNTLAAGGPKLHHTSGSYTVARQSKNHPDQHSLSEFKTVWSRRRLRVESPYFILYQVSLKFVTLASSVLISPL